MAQTNPPQPVGQGQYPLTDLVPSYIQQYTNQAGYTRATGKQSPPLNPAEPIKTWADTRVFKLPSENVDYLFATLDPTGQYPIITPTQLPAFIASGVNIPPDQGPWPGPDTQNYPVPIRPLLPNEQLIAAEGGVIEVVNTDIFDPNPMLTLKHLLMRVVAKLGA